MTPKRIQRKRTRGWRMPPNTVYVGRPTRWGNPYDWKTIGRETAVKFFRLELLSYVDGLGVEATKVQEIKKALAALRGKDLACWCRLDQPCHADVLLELANA